MKKYELMKYIMVDLETDRNNTDHVSRRRDQRIERLLAVADLLSNLKPTKDKKFDMRDFCTKETCGTTACAIGWAMFDPWFRARGFRDCEDYGDLVPLYQGVTGFHAIELFFNIQEEIAEYLFQPDDYLRTDDPQEVAARIVDTADMYVELQNIGA